MNFTSVDFETAKGQRHTICQIGLTIVENGVITKELSFHVKPPNNEYSDRNIEVHGITPEITQDCPTFDELWPSIKEYIENKTVIAHNGAFDFDCLIKTLEYYKITPPLFIGKCTYRIFGLSLKDACIKHDIELGDHHNALSDSRACANLYLKYLNSL